MRPRRWWLFAFGFVFGIQQRLTARLVGQRVPPRQYCHEAATGAGPVSRPSPAVRQPSSLVGVRRHITVVPTGVTDSISATTPPVVYSQDHDSFWALAQEEGDSRIWGGIHFRFEIDASLEKYPTNFLEPLGGNE